MELRLFRTFDADAMAAALDDDSVGGCIIELHSGADAARASDGALLRRMEQSKPVAAVLRGRIADASLAVALACHRRFATAHTVIAGSHGMPVAGLSQRMLRLAGFPATLSVLLEGRALDAEAALRAGLIDVIGEDTLLADATAWTRGAAGVTQPWDRKGFAIPGPDLRGAGANAFAMAVAAIHGRTGGKDRAALAVLQAVHDGFSVPFDMALRIERALA